MAKKDEEELWRAWKKLESENVELILKIERLTQENANLAVELDSTEYELNIFAQDNKILRGQLKALTDKHEAEAEAVKALRDYKDAPESHRREILSKVWEAFKK